MRAGRKGGSRPSAARAETARALAAFPEETTKLASGPLSGGMLLMAMQAGLVERTFEARGRRGEKVAIWRLTDTGRRLAEEGGT